MIGLIQYIVGNLPFRKERVMNIVLVGPVYPYKGGISHYTSMMYSALAKKHNVKMVSYKMQYPRFLFHKEQKDYSDKQFEIKDTHYLLNTANPFNIVAAAGKIRKFLPDLVIIQWWHPYFAPCYWILSSLLGKKTKLIYICHNVFPHERFPADKFLTKLALKKAHGYIVQSRMDGDDLKIINKDANYIFTPHPTYNVFKVVGMTKRQAREMLEIGEDEKFLLFFGFVREYKGLRYLLDAMPEILKRHGNVKLWIVGDFGEDKEKYLSLIDELGIKNHIRIVDGYIPNQEVEKYFQASDIVVLPYISATQSGIVQIAYGFDKPVLVTNVGGLPDVVRDHLTGYIVEPKNPAAIAQAIIEFIDGDENVALEYEKNIQKEADRFSWERMVECIEEIAV